MVMYLVGRIFPLENERQWEVLGIYTTEDKAISSCSMKDDFITALEVDIIPIQKTKPFNGYYPLFKES